MIPRNHLGLGCQFPGLLQTSGLSFNFCARHDRLPFLGPCKLMSSDLDPSQGCGEADKRCALRFPEQRAEPGAEAGMSSSARDTWTGSPKEPTLLPCSSGTSNLQSYEMIRFCCLSHPVCSCQGHKSRRVASTALGLCPSK